MKRCCADCATPLVQIHNRNWPTRCPPCAKRRTAELAKARAAKSRERRKVEGVKKLVCAECDLPLARGRRCPECAETHRKALHRVVMRRRRGSVHTRAYRRSTTPFVERTMAQLSPAEREGLMLALGGGAKKARAIYRDAMLTHEDLVHEGWLAWLGARRRHWSYERALYYAWNHMKQLCRRDMAPLSGRDRELRKLTVLNGVSPFIASPTRGHFGRRLTRGDWRALKTAMRRILLPRECEILMRRICERESLGEIALALGITEKAVLNHRNKAVFKMRRATRETCQAVEQSLPLASV